MAYNDVASLIQNAINANKQEALRQELARRNEVAREKQMLADTLQRRGKAALVDTLLSNDDTNMSVSNVANAATANPNILANQLGYNAMKTVVPNNEDKYQYALAQMQQQENLLKEKENAAMQRAMLAAKLKMAMDRQKMQAAQNGAYLKPSAAAYNMIARMQKDVHDKIGTAPLETLDKALRGALLSEDIFNKPPGSVAISDVSPFLTMFYKTLSEDVGNVTENEAMRAAFKSLETRMKELLNNIEGKEDVPIDSKQGKMVLQAFANALDATKRKVQNVIQRNKKYLDKNDLYKKNFLGVSMPDYIDNTYKTSEEYLKSMDDMKNKLLKLAGSYAKEYNSTFTTEKRMPSEYVSEINSLYEKYGKD